MKTLLSVLFLSLSLLSFSQNVSWLDDINNKANEGRVYSIFEEIDRAASPYEMQIEYCKRYYTSLTQKSKEWYDAQPKGYTVYEVVMQNERIISIKVDAFSTWQSAITKYPNLSINVPSINGKIDSKVYYALQGIDNEEE